MRTTNLKVKLKNKTFILAGLKLFLNTENCYSLLLYICQDGSCCLCGSLDKFKNWFIADDRIFTYKHSHDSLLMLILFLGFCNVWLWSIGNILKEHKDGGNVFHWNADSTAYCAKSPKQDHYYADVWHCLYFYNDLSFSAADEDCLINYKHACMRSWYINNQFSWMNDKHVCVRS